MKITLRLATYLCLLTTPAITYAQTKYCGSDAHWQQIKQKDKTKGVDLKQLFRNNLRTQAPTLLTIPVVVHVLYNSSLQNISNEQIYSQLDILNKDYRKLNTDITKVPTEFAGMAADCGIQFCLAQRDPSGLPSTGITRTYTSKNNFLTSLQDAKHASTGGYDVWNPKEYLNIWIVPNIDGDKDVLAYASHPEDPEETDGVVICYKYFGNKGTAEYPFNQGRTATHEVGHWLGLYHTFDEGCAGVSEASCNELGDLVCDTPPVANPSYDCPSYPKNTCNEANNKNDMTMNFMDYVDDACMYMFTSGQKDRMWYHINTFRSALFTSKGCTAPTQADNNIALSKLDGASKSGLCDPHFAPTVTLVNIGSNTVTNVVLEYGTAEAPATTTWSGSLAYGASTQVPIPAVTLASGQNDYYIKVRSVNQAEDTDTSKNTIKQTIKVFPTVALPYEEGFEDLQKFTRDWTVIDYGDEIKWYRSPLAAAQGSYSLFADNYNGSNGEIDEVYSPLFHLQKNAELSFDYAYSLYTEIGTDEDYADTLQILLDLECAGKPTKVYEGFGEDFATRDPYFTTERYIPTENEWRHVTVNLANYENKKARLVFRNISDVENSLFIDNIQLSDIPLGVDDALALEGISVYPTVTQGPIQVLCHTPYEVALYSSSGVLLETNLNRGNPVLVDVSGYPDQLMMVQVRTNTGIKNFKIVKKGL